MTHKNDRVLSVKELSRVEGEGALYLRASGNRVEEARLDIYEPPRFFEAFLRGRAYTEPPPRARRRAGHRGLGRRVRLPRSPVPGRPAGAVPARHALAVVVDAVRVLGSERPHPGQVHRFVVDRPGTAAGHGSQLARLRPRRRDRPGRSPGPERGHGLALPGGHPSRERPDPGKQAQPQVRSQVNSPWPKVTRFRDLSPCRDGHYGGNSPGIVQV